ncbi:uncharacterized protein LOC143109412 isoform X2 [Alosa pseudoharengus]|uniref:uncharacterized protein LOC143109412 isoform X1 n=1 Tax=Alosa pseudoharengus TaxID=34774 RepID=UPI003F8A5600
MTTNLGIMQGLDAEVTLASKLFSFLWAIGMRTPIIKGLLIKLSSLYGTVLPIYLEVTAGIKVFTVLTGNTLGSHESFRNRLATQLNLTEVPLVEDCDVILAYCPIVSRVGTDIGAALSVIPDCRPAVLMVFHHTNDKYYIVPNTNRFTQDRGISTINCLFNDDGLLKAPQNNEAFRLAVKHLKLFHKGRLLRLLTILQRWVGYMPSEDH